MKTKRYTEADGYFIEARLIGSGEDSGNVRREDPAYELMVGRGEQRAKHWLMLTKPQALPPALLRNAPKGMSNATHFFAGTALRHGARTWIEALWNEQQTALHARVAAEDAAEAAIPGLPELRAALDDEARYQRQFARMMEDEGNDGCCPPRRPKADSGAIAATYPAAAVYVRAESYQSAAHWAKSKAGREAREIILAGGDVAAARAKLENWLTDNGVEVD